MRRKGLPLIAVGMLLGAGPACEGQQAASLPSGKASPHVTAHLKAMPLREAMKELTRLTGIPLEASPPSVA